MKVAAICPSLTHRSALSTVFSQLGFVELQVCKELEEIKSLEEIQLFLWIDEEESSRFLFHVRSTPTLSKVPVLLFSNRLMKDLVIRARLDKMQNVRHRTLPVNKSGAIHGKELQALLCKELKQIQRAMETTQREEQAPRYQELLQGHFDAVLIGISTGGPAALKLMLPELTKQISHPVIIVQHMPEHMQNHYVGQLQKSCPDYTVKLAKDGEFLSARTVYVGPIGFQLRVGVGLQSRRILRLRQEAPINDFLPSADALFSSGAKVFGKRCLAVIMTGMGEDGVKGLREVYNLGGMILAQDQQSSVVWGMPGAAVKAGIAHQVADLNQIPELIAKALKEGE